MSVRPPSRYMPRKLPFWQQLRWRLVILFIVLALLPMGFLFGVMDEQTSRQYTDQTVAQLESVAELKSDQISRFLEDGDTAAEILLADQSHYDLFVSLLTEDNPDQAMKRSAFILLREAVNAQHNLKELTLYRPDGTVVAASIDHLIGTNISREPYFEPSLEASSEHVAPPYFSHAVADFVVVLTHRLSAEDGTPVGVLAAELHPARLGLIMTERTGLGATGETYLVSREEGLLLTPVLDETIRVGTEIHGLAVERALAGEQNHGTYTNYANENVIGSYRWLPEIEAALIAEIHQDEAFAARETTRQSSRSFAALAALIAAVLGLFAATFIASPVQEMTEVARDIAGGDLSRRVKRGSGGEIGVLGEAFNLMAYQLQELVGTLETRVQDRTRALELAAEVAREVSAALNLEQLLSRVVELTKARFALYHAHVYLLDDQKQRLVMEAGAGEAGRQMKEAAHSIPLNAERSLVARAARTGQSVIVNDVIAEDDHLPNPLLPNTRSEMAVPMKLGEQVLGVLDVQADKPDRFTETDSHVMTTLAGQVAVAVQNARLFARTGESEQLLRSVLDASRDWIWAKDRNYNYILVNEAFAQQGFGLPVKEVLGKNDYDIFPRELVDGDPARGIKGLRADDTSALSGQNIRIPEDIVVHADGSEHILDTQKSPLYDVHGNIIGTLGIGRDITAQINARRRQETAYEMGERITSHLDMPVLLHETVELLSQTFSYYHAHIYLMNEDQRGLVVAEGLGEAGAAMKALGHSIPLDAERSLVARAARTHQPVVVNDVEVEPDHLPNPLLPETRSEVAVPLLSGDRVLGVLDVQQNHAGQFDEDEIRTLQIIATQVSIALANARLFEEAQTALSETASLYAATDQIGKATSMEEVLQAIIQPSVLGTFERANILLFDRPWVGDARPERMMIAAVWERNGQAPLAPVGTTYSLDRMPVVGYMAHDTPMIVKDVSADERVDEYTKSLFAQLGMNAVIGLPLTIGNQWIGMVTAQNFDTLEVDEKQVRFVQALMDQAAGVVQNLRLYQEIQSALSESRATQRLLRSVIDTTPDWIWVRDGQGRFVTMNRTMAEKLGLRSEAVLGKFGTDLGLAPEVEEALYQDDTSVLTGMPLSFTQHLMLTGEIHTVLDTRKLPLYDAEQNIVAVLGIATDVTERLRAQQRERLAYELGQELAVLFDPERLLQQTISHLSEALGFYHAHIYRVDEENRQLLLAEGLGEVGAMLKEMQHSIPLDAERSLVARAARTLEPVVVNDVATNPEHLPNPLLPETRSEAAMPLYAGQRLLGVLDVQHSTVNAFPEPEVRTLRVVANHLASALSNAELYQEQLQNAERLRELDRLKSEFLANMSHELRTPLNSIIGYSELLIDEVGPTLDAMSAEDLKAIHSSGQHLLAIINDILDLAKIEAGRLELNRTRLSIESVAMPLADSARVLLKDKPDVELQIDLPADLPEIEADTVRLRQILWNLLSNAIKFTDTGSICLSARRNDGVLEIAVKDTGAGIDPRYHQVVFDQFRQADGSATRKAGGTGLGLAITRQLVELHGGRLWLDSYPGKGSTFAFTLPLTSATQTAEAAVAAGD